MSELTNFQILQLAATLATATDKEPSPKSAVERMFECATLIRIKMGDTELEAAYKEEKAQKAVQINEALQKLNKSLG